MIKAVIFDLDGTLVNSVKDIADSMNKVLEHFGYATHDYDAYKTFVGQGLRKMCELAMPQTARNEQQIEQCFQLLMDIYSENCTNKTKPYDGINDMLTNLQDRGIRLAVFSNKVDILTKKVVATTFSDFKFDIVIGSGGNIPRKPATKGVDYICEQMNLNPNEFIYVGDSAVDMQTANQSGIYSVGVLWGYRDMEELLENNANVIIEHPMDLFNSL